MLSRYVFLILIAALAVAVIPAKAVEKGKAQTLCPVMGGEINKEVYTDHEGTRVYFCCPGCIGKFNSDPETYIQKMEKEGIVLERAPKAQTHCPVMGGEINKKVYQDYKGKRVYFCCPGCLEKFKADPDSYIKKLEEQGIKLEKTPEK
jgi:YHS domain-containing protein